MRGDEDDSECEGYGSRGFKAVIASAQHPRGDWSDQQRDGRNGGRQAQSGERFVCKVEEVRGGERVVAYAAMGEQDSDVGNVGKVARRPQPVSERGGGEYSYGGKGGLHACEPFAGGADPARVAAWSFFDASECARDKDEDGGPRRPGVVLLIGRNGEEDQDEDGVDAEQESGSSAEADDCGGTRYRLRRGTGFEIGQVGGLVVDVGGKGSTITPGPNHGGGNKDAPREQPHELAKPVGEPRLLVVVVRVALAEEAQEMLVNEVEVEEAVNIAGVRDVAHGMSLVWIAQPAKDVPRRPYRQK